MTAPSPTRFGRLCAALAAALALAAAGCEPSEIVWLPDSSGFVYPDKQNTRLVHFDLAKNAKRVVVEDAARECSKPAVSPDGTQFALASHTYTIAAGSDQLVNRVQITFYDRDGTEKKKSKVFEFSVKGSKVSKDESGTLPARIIWKGHKDRVLTSHGIYDRAQDKWLKITGTPAVFMRSDCPPVDKGFLTYRWDDKNSLLILAFVDWDGWSSDFKEKFDYPTDSTAGKVVGGKWDGDVWHLVTEKGRVAFDTTKLTHQLKLGGDPVWEAIRRPADHHRFAGTDLFLTSFYAYNSATNSSTSSLELHKLQLPDKAKNKVLYTHDDYPTFRLYPSPDGKKVAVWCQRHAQKQVYDPVQKKYVPRVPPIEAKEDIMVFDSTGEVVATVKPEQ